MAETVKIEKLVHGGQGLATLADGRKVFVWNALPDEEVIIEISKGKRKYAEALAVSILKSSKVRVAPKDAAYLSTSPWQIMTFEAENSYKQLILSEAVQRENVAYSKPIKLSAGQEQWHYRNKMEYSFWADDTGLHLAMFNRGTHGKLIVEGSSIARPEIDQTAKKIVQLLSQNHIRGSQLKTVVVRCDQKGATVIALFVKDENFPRLDFAAICKGAAVYYSTPKSPASVMTKKLYKQGDITLTDNIMSNPITYDVNSFFQVNLPIFKQAATRIAHFVNSVEGQKNKVDLYSGVGTLAVPLDCTKLVEIDAHNIVMAKKNVGSKNIEVIHAAAEIALQHIPANGTLIIDPPRAGLHSKVINRILEAKPHTIAYLSCNPSTQARDLALLQDTYTITNIEGYNFFPRTPHIETLAVLQVL